MRCIRQERFRSGTRHLQTQIDLRFLSQGDKVTYGLSGFAPNNNNNRLLLNYLHYIDALHCDVKCTRRPLAVYNT